MKPFTIITLVVSVVLFSACGPSSEVIATQTAVAQTTIIAETSVAATATAVASAPKSGHWEGSNPPVSFEVTNEGYIRNFSMTIPFALGKCTITIDNVAIQTDGTFVISEMAPTNSGESKEVNHFSGKFDSPTKLTGSYGKILICGIAPDRWISMSKVDGKWTAAWKNP